MEAEPKRILFICHDGSLYGSQQSLNLMVSYLDATRFRCIVSIARPGPLNALLVKIPHLTVRSHKRLQWVKHDPRSLVRRIGDFLNLLIAALPRAIALAAVIRREKIDLVHTNATVSLEGALAAALVGVPHVWHIRELFMEKSPKFHMVLGCKISRWMIDRFSDRVLCISQSVRSQFGEYADADPERYQLLYNALMTDEADKPPPVTPAQAALIRILSWRSLNLPEDEDLCRIGYIGRLSEGKGLHDLIAALAVLRSREFKAILVVAGSFVDDAYQARIEALIAEADLKEAVFLLGYREDLAPVYEAIDLLVVPSVNEPFGRVLIEAMLKGVACIGTKSGGIPEIIDDGETGLLYPPGDSDALARCIEMLASAEWKRDTIRHNAGRMVRERFTIETQIKALEECYRSVLLQHHL